MALESSPENPQPLQVIAEAVRGWIDRLGVVWVTGQVVELNRRSGTVFLVLRDTDAAISVSVSMSPVVLDRAGPVAEGATVVARVKPQYWKKSGRLSFECSDLRPTGEGRLLAQLEHLKRTLQAEGLFDPIHRKPLPFLPRRVGVITGANTAAERDVLEHLQRRWPAVQIELQHTLVQGTQAAEQVMDALARLDGHPEVDVIIIARGGGSVEDLMPFNNEGLVRAVAACRTPVVSAIGHETDTPIIDLVADLRASTPTDAAKRVVPDVAEEQQRVTEALTRVRQALRLRLDRERQSLNDLCHRPVLRDPSATLVVHREQLVTAHERLQLAISRRVAEERRAIDNELARVRAMSPKATLQRGYAILTDGTADTITSIADVDVDDDIAAQLADGRLILAVREAEPHSPAGDEQ
ncbi:exodeoxyribonuclease VII large subunit [Enemella sp. A6]|uniref:exodeoxyribonuclease VII large subunit n=1 Tax=Enemella sp. A6 TaxID=3440152 RepID=UPI003EBC4675